MSCEKNDLEPSYTGAPQLYVQADIDGQTIKYLAGLDTYIASPERISNDSLLVFNFAILDVENLSRRYFEVAISNWKIPTYSDIETDLDNTITVGNYNYTLFNPYPSEVDIRWYSSIQNFYCSSFGPQPSGSFDIISVSDTIRPHSTTRLKKVYAEFNCLLYEYFLTDTLELTNGKASIVF